MSGPNAMTHAVDSTNLADLIERILDKGIVVAGDINIKLVDIELLSIQIRLVICSVDRAIELGFDWWNHENRHVPKTGADDAALKALDQRLGRMEEALTAIVAASAERQEHSA